jgi:cysteine desulfurase
MPDPPLMPIYLDHHATTPVLPEVVEAMRAYWGEPNMNPASQHAFGRRARRVVEDARDNIGGLLGANLSGRMPDRVIFTSGGTEANNLAIRGLLRDEKSHPAIGSSCGHFIVSAIEHPSITSVADELARTGWCAERLGVDGNGMIRVDDLLDMLRPETRLVAAMLANNETGVLQPVPDLAAICNDRKLPLHTDAAQIAGKLPVRFHALGVATMAIAAHKFHGPVGVGALLVRGDIDLQPQLWGGFQQAGLRPGTEPVALIVGMCRALELWDAERDERATRMRALRDRFEHQILTRWPSAIVICANVPRLPDTSQIAFVGLNRQALFMALDQTGVACSTGSACASGSSEVSPVLSAIGCSEAVLNSALRFSLGATTTAAQIDEAATRIIRCCNALRDQKRG